MKIASALLLGLVLPAFALIPVFVSAQSASEPAMPKELQRAISKSVITVNGRQYPALPGGSCKLGDMKPFGPAAYVNLAGGNHQRQSVATPAGPPRVASYSPPNADWLIQFYDRHVDSANGTFVAQDVASPPNYSFTSVNYNALGTNMDNFVASLGLNGQLAALLNARVGAYLLNYEAYVNSLGNANGSVRLMAQVWGTGALNANPGHSWYTGWIVGSLVCAPAYLHDQDALEARLKQWVRTVLAKAQIPAK